MISLLETTNSLRALHHHLEEVSSTDHQRLEFVAKAPNKAVWKVNQWSIHSLSTLRSLMQARQLLTGTISQKAVCQSSRRLQKHWIVRLSNLHRLVHSYYVMNRFLLSWSVMSVVSKVMMMLTTSRNGVLVLIHQVKAVYQIVMIRRCLNGPSS